MKLVGVGPGDPELITVKGRMAIEECQVIVGWGSVVERFSALTQGKEIIVLTYKKEHEGLSLASKREDEGKSVCLLDHGDPGVSDWQFVEKAKSFFKNVEVVPGVSVVNAALDRIGEDLGKNCFVTLHVRGDITPFMNDILTCLKMGRGVLVNPEPYDDGPQRVARFLMEKGIEGKIVVMEKLTYPDSSVHEFNVDELSASHRKFSDLTIIHIRST
ncbi:cobalt-precorrin-7 (C(5))-methyltransferase [Sulfuracidifex tepidarius]|uniref:Tetrapyrrole methylase domain-containing protein n=1 Tax=Sulfuracidifex tepidarius TaxID=1294262 RepID=A0A510E3J2_9CREN|nr:cobalt-precorrin-7 (C(5))-methyltransferase [Sulfuracidifex tepidarius]BBG24317.1 hypothetical protein IC006_1627 [Sulfuracidifex tepidarius]BBG27074.1 hypothetical protein IC007_1604 [Sulfuracidifex tepidarius]